MQTLAHDSLADDQQRADELRPIKFHARRVLGKETSPSQEWRWIHKGVCGGAVRLRASRISGKWYCTEADLRQFIADQTAHALSSVADGPDDTEVRERTDKALASVKAG